MTITLDSGVVNWYGGDIVLIDYRGESMVIGNAKTQIEAVDAFISWHQ